jgi:hypothetical protein
MPTQFCYLYMCLYLACSAPQSTSTAAPGCRAYMAIQHLDDAMSTQATCKLEF